MGFFPSSKGLLFGSMLAIGQHGTPMLPDQAYAVQPKLEVNVRAGIRLAYPEERVRQEEGTPDIVKPEIVPTQVIIAESDAAFHRLSQLDHAEATRNADEWGRPGRGLFGQYNVIMTGKGFPDHSTRELLAHLRSARSPIQSLRGCRLVIITDCDPAGLWLHMMFKIGTAPGALRCGGVDAHAQPDAKWLGVTPQMMERAAGDRTKAFTWKDAKYLRLLDGRLRQADGELTMPREWAAVAAFTALRRKVGLHVLEVNGTLMDELEDEYNELFPRRG